MPTKKLKAIPLDTMIDRHIGKVGTAARDAFEHALTLDLLGYAIKEARLYHKRLKSLNWRIILQMPGSTPS